MIASGEARARGWTSQLFVPLRPLPGLVMVLQGYILSELLSFFLSPQ